MTAPATSAAPSPALGNAGPDLTAAPTPASNGIPGRFAWERELRGARISRTIKGFLLYLGTFMDGNGRNCRPSSRTIGDDLDIGRQRVFELLAEAEESGWVRTEKRPGKPSERLPAIPTRQARPDGSAASGEGDPSGATRRVERGSDGGTRQAAPDATRQARADPTGTGPQENGGTLPPGPLRPEHPAGTRTGRIDPLTAVPDLNETKQVTSKTRARIETVNRPLIAVIDNPQFEEDEMPSPPPRHITEELLPALAAQLTKINTRKTPTNDYLCDRVDLDYDDPHTITPTTQIGAS